MEGKDAIRERHKGGIDDNGRVLVYNLGSRYMSFFAIPLKCVQQGLCTRNDSRNAEQKNQVIEEYIQHDSIMLFKSK